MLHTDHPMLLLYVLIYLLDVINRTLHRDRYQSHTVVRFEVVLTESEFEPLPTFKV